MNYAVSNIISAIIYGSRFEYDDPEFTAMVDRANETIRLTPLQYRYNLYFHWD